MSDLYHVGLQLIFYVCIANKKQLGLPNFKSSGVNKNKMVRLRREQFFTETIVENSLLCKSNMAAIVRRFNVT
jgi:hypothetical protein